VSKVSLGLGIAGVVVGGATLIAGLVSGFNALAGKSVLVLLGGLYFLSKARRPVSEEDNENNRSDSNLDRR